MTDKSENSNHRIKSGSQKKILAPILVLIIFLAGLLFLSRVVHNRAPDSNTDQSSHDSDGSLKNSDPNRIESGLHVRTGLKDGEGLLTVVAHCTACHSAKLVIQNRMSRERWNATIRWMQETQNLWELGDDQIIIVDYLVDNYPASKKGRRENLNDINWYDLPE